MGGGLPAAVRRTTALVAALILTTTTTYLVVLHDHDHLQGFLPDHHPPAGSTGGDPTDLEVCDIFTLKLQHNVRSSGSSSSRDNGRSSSSGGPRRQLPEDDMRLLCGAEAAAKHHPHAKVCILVLDDGVTTTTTTLGSLDRRVRRLNLATSVTVLPLDLEAVFRGSPLEGWWVENLNRSLSVWRTYHLSNAAKLAILWKVGGTGLDTDLVLIRPTDPLGPNFVALQPAAGGQQGLSTAVMRFSQRRHPFLSKWLFSIPERFKEDVRASAGSTLATELIVPFCQGDVPYSASSAVDLHQLSDKFCDYNLHVLRQSALYSGPWTTDPGGGFTSALSSARLPADFSADNDTYGVHFQELSMAPSSPSRSLRPRRDPASDMVFFDLAEAHCPLTLAFSLRKRN